MTTRFFFSFFLAKNKGGFVGRATSSALMSSSSSSSSFCGALLRNDGVLVGRASSSSSSNVSRRSFLFFEGGGGGGGGGGGRTIGENIFWSSSSSLRGGVNGSSNSISSSSVSSRRFSGAQQQQEEQQRQTREEEDALHLSEKCEDQLRSIFLKEMEKGGGKEGALERKSILRIGVDGGGCAGFQYTFALVDEKDVKDASGDRVFRGRKFPEEAKVVCDEVSFAYLKGSTVDYAEEMIRSAFEVVKNPNAEQKCGCGVSFEAKF